MTNKKYTADISAVITADLTQAQLVETLSGLLNNAGTNVLIQTISLTQWVDPTNSKPQVFNDDGTPNVEASEE